MIEREFGEGRKHERERSLRTERAGVTMIVLVVMLLLLPILPFAVV